ncbi:MAG: YveK family protein [Thermoleophilia bacterium]
MGLTEFLSIIWRSKWIILVTAIAATIFVASETLRQPTKYEAGAVLAVGNLNSGKALGLATGEDRLASTYADLLNIEDVYQRSVEKSDADVTPELLKSHVSVSTAKESPYIKLTASDTDAAATVEEVNAVANGLVAYVTEMQDKNLQNGRQAIQQQLTQVESERNKIRAGDPQQQGHLDALTAVRDSLIKQNEQNITDTTYSRLSVLSLAKTAAMQPPQKMRNILLGLLVGTIAGLAMGFIYDSVVKALNHET